MPDTVGVGNMHSAFMSLGTTAAVCLQYIFNDLRLLELYNLWCTFYYGGNLRIMHSRFGKYLTERENSVISGLQHIDPLFQGTPILFHKSLY